MFFFSLYTYFWKRCGCPWSQNFCPKNWRQLFLNLFTKKYSSQEDDHFDRFLRLLAYKFKKSVGLKVHDTYIITIRHLLSRCANSFVNVIFYFNHYATFAPIHGNLDSLWGSRDGVLTPCARVYIEFSEEKNLTLYCAVEIKLNLFRTLATAKNGIIK